VLEACCRSPVTFAARFEAGADSSVGRGRAQHPAQIGQGSWGSAADCSLGGIDMRPWPLKGCKKARPGKQPIYDEGHRQEILKMLDKTAAGRVRR